MRTKLVQLTQLLLQLLDGFVMPADLVGSGEDLREALMRGQSSGSVTMASSASADASRFALPGTTSPFTCYSNAKHLDGRDRNLPQERPSAANMLTLCLGSVRDEA